MKNLKKIAALVIVLAMALSTVAFAFTDVAEDAGYYEAVEVMSGLGLLKGYEDGTFGPDKTITRAEFAAVVVRALGMEDAAAGAVANTMFTDVASSHWAAGYVQVANQQGIIAGYGDGTFGPEDEVTYEQAVKMIVCALGYGVKFAGVANAYPSAYLSQANTSGITVGAAGKIGEKATRATVAKLVYNALDVKLMEQTGFGTEEKFEEVDKTLLSSRLNMIKVEATIEALNFDPEKADKVTIANAKMSKIYAAAIDALYENTIDYTNINTEHKYASNVELKKGYNCVAYLDVSEDDYVIKAMVPKAGKNSTLVLTGVQTKDSDSAAEDVKVKDKEGNESTVKVIKELKYYKTNADVDTNTTKIKVEGAQIFVNKNATAETDLAAFITNWNAGNYDEITLIDNGNDNKYEYIYVSNYEAWVVDEINESRNRIDSASNDSIVLDPEDEGYTFEIKDINGNELAFADIKVGDVLNIFESEDAEGKLLKEVIVTNETVEGTITEKNNVTGKITIGDKEYAGTGYNVGDAGKFTVDMYGNIIDHDIDASNRKFGMIYSLYNDETGVDAVPTAIILTAEGKFESYTFAKKVDLDTVKKGATRADVEKHIKDNLKGEKDVDILKLGVYTLNSSNEITKLLYTKSEIEALDASYAVKAKVADKEYDAAAEDIDSLYVADSSIILTCKDANYVTADRTIKYGAAAKSYFVDEEKYTFEAITEDDEIIVAMVFGATAQVDKASMAMYVTSVTDTTDSEGDEAIKVKGYVDGELVSIIIPDDIDGNEDEKVKVGSMIQYLGEGEATALKVLVEDASKVKAGLVAGLDEDKDGVADNAKEGYFAYAGKVQKIAKDKFYFEDGTTVTFAAGTTAMLVKANGKVFANDLAAKDIDKIEKFDNPETEKVEKPDDMLILYMYDGKAIGAIIYDANNDTKN